MKSRILIVAILAISIIHPTTSENQSSYNSSRRKRQTNADQMVQNILQWLQGVYSQSSRTIRQGTLREYLPPPNTQKPRPFEQGGYPPAGSITPQPPFNIFTNPTTGAVTGEGAGYSPPNNDIAPGYEGKTQRPQSPFTIPIGSISTGFPGFSTGTSDQFPLGGPLDASTTPYPTPDFPTKRPADLPSSYPTDRPGFSTQPPPGIPTGYPSERPAGPGFPSQPPTGYPSERPGFPTQPPPGISTGYPSEIPAGSGFPSQPPTGYPSERPGFPTQPPSGISTGYPSERPAGPGFPTQPPTRFPSEGPDVSSQPNALVPSSERPAEFSTQPPRAGFPTPEGIPSENPDFPTDQGQPGGVTGSPQPGAPTGGYPDERPGMSSQPPVGYPTGETGISSLPPKAGFPTLPPQGFTTDRLGGSPTQTTPEIANQPSFPTSFPSGFTTQPPFSFTTSPKSSETDIPPSTSPPIAGFTSAPATPKVDAQPEQPQSTPQSPETNTIPTGKPEKIDSRTELSEEDLKHPPHIHAIDVQCAKDMMTINIEFNRQFDGVIYSKGYYTNPDCRYVTENSGQTRYSFTVSLNSCGTEFVNAFDTQGQSYLENILVLQNEPGIQEVWDTVRSVRCLWEGNLKESLSVALSVGMLSQEIVTFSGDTAMAKLDIQLGRGPFGPPANGLIKIGEPMTLVVSVSGDPGFDIQVKDCKATDSGGSNVVQLTDDNGCVLKTKLFGAFQKTRNTGNTGASVIAYAYFNAFKFPDVMDLMIECNIELCKTDCEMCPDPDPQIDPARRRRRRDVYGSNHTHYEEGVTMGKHLRVILPEDLNEINFSTNDVCMSTQNFLLYSTLLISLMVSSSIFSAYLWFKSNRMYLAKK